ncbi:MAG: bifunctional oligoribonuclease/PAP phosphatase NrnA [candidate division Zixibacteria bacterium]|nr:bifunctional oligoribonuclease/PAP phosphatase NrnA [candidate division Zixibacteria bacterium]
MNLREKTKKSNFASPHINQIRKIKKLLQDSRQILVVSHIDPDGDAVGTQLAFAAYLKDLGKKVYLIRDSEIPAKYLFLQHVDDIKKVEDFPSELDIDTALILECPTVERIGGATGFLNDRVKTINIDHHQDSTPFATVNWIDTGASSVGEMAFEYFAAVDYDISADVAEQLYTAILTDTGRFRYASTTPRTMTIAGLLLEAGADSRKICDYVYYNLDPAVMKLTGWVLNTIEMLNDGKICLIHLTNEMLTRAGARVSDTEGLVDLTMFNMGVQVGCLLKEIDESRTKLSLRARDNINVAEIAGRFNGGGHVSAAGCIIPLPLSEARQKIIGILTEVVNAG